MMVEVVRVRMRYQLCLLEDDDFHGRCMPHEINYVSKLVASSRLDPMSSRKFEVKLSSAS